MDCFRTAQQLRSHFEGYAYDSIVFHRFRGQICLNPVLAGWAGKASERQRDRETAAHGAPRRSNRAVAWKGAGKL